MQNKGDSTDCLHIIRYIIAFSVSYTHLFLANKRAEFGFGIGKLQDNYFQSSVINFEEDRSDRSLYRLIGGSIRCV